MLCQRFLRDLDGLRSGKLEEYATLEPTFTEEFLPTVGDWILERVDVVE